MDRAREGTRSWRAHRISGMLIFLFLLVHVLYTALVRVSPEAYNEVIGHYKTVVFGLGEVGLVAAVVFHALNGLRIILVDFWSGGTRQDRKSTRLNSSHVAISYAVFCLKKKKM